jgi:hypothetical protein
VTWTRARVLLPFLTGAAIGVALAVALFISWHAARSAVAHDWGYFTLQALCAVTVFTGVVLLLVATMEF